MLLPIDSSNEKGIGSALAHYGSREEDQLLILKNNIKEGMRILDIGGNIGYYALLVSSLAGDKGKVYSVEPSADNINHLKENVALNKKEEQIEVFHMGISNNEETQTLYLSEHSNLHGFFESTMYQRKESHTEEIKMASIDSFVKDKLPIDFIRMDVEGFEVKVFEGMHWFVENSDNELGILFEVHRSRYDNNEFNMRKELRYLFEQGFVPEVLTTKPLIEAMPWGKDPFSKLGYQPERIVHADGIKRAYYTNIKNADVLDLVCEVGCVRAMFMKRPAK